MCEWQRTQGETFASFAALRNGSKLKVAEAIPLNAQATWRVHHLAPQELSGAVAELSQSLNQIIEKFMKAGKARS